MPYLALEKRKARHVINPSSTELHLSTQQHGNVPPDQRQERSRALSRWNPPLFNVQLCVPAARAAAACPCSSPRAATNTSLCQSALSEARREAGLWAPCDRLTGCREIMKESSRHDWHKPNQGFGSEDLRCPPTHSAVLITPFLCHFFTDSRSSLLQLWPYFMHGVHV